MKSSVFDLLSPVLADEGIELVDVEYQAGGGGVLRLLIDKPGGVNLHDCQHVSRFAEPILDVHGAIQGEYSLEVASPGVDRPLVTEADFRRNLGRKIQIEMSSAAGDFLQLNGTLKAVNAGKISLIQTSGKTIQVVISEIVKAQIQLMW
ncbi:MAG: ribosome maturation factor RimP [Candidatus Poribacteria bacterium]|nr:ribosome maturation factor RimP [Candidatus Poribacteria bacterium]